MRTVELLGGDGLDRAVRAAWRRLDQAGLPSLGQHRHLTNRPHLTLASADGFPPGAAAAIADALRDLQPQIWSALEGTDRNPRHEPSAWTPHISLARRLPADQQALATQAVGEAGVDGEFTAARSYDSTDWTVIPLP